MKDPAAKILQADRRLRRRLALAALARVVLPALVERSFFTAA